ncbi:hypothetical protein D3C77_654330 [compost metagenome]
MIQFYVFSVYEHLKHAGENEFQHVFHSLGTKTVDGAKVWTLPPRDPHEHDVLANGFGNLP